MHFMKLTPKRAALAGFTLGLVLSAGYLVSGGSTFFNVPLWASILFCTGFFVGTWTNFEITSQHNIPEIVGCLTVAVTYALLFGALFTLCQCAARKKTIPANVQPED